MAKPCSAVLLATLGIPCIAQTPVLQWGHALSGPGNSSSAINSCRGLATDPDGNVYTVGEFANNLDLDPGTNTAMVTSEGLNYFDMFLAKYNSVGQYIWGKKITTGTLCYANFLERAPSGDLVMAGYLGGTTDFDPGAGTTELTGAGDLFFARYTSDGDLVWAKTFGSASGIDELHAMELDANGNIWIAGAFNDTIDLDPGPNIAQFLCTPASRDGFFVKYDAGGNYLWGHTFGDTWSDMARGIAFDASGNAVITGVFRTSMDVEPGAGTTMIQQLGSGGDTFIATYAQDGDLLNWFSFGGQASELYPTGIAVDSNGDLLVMGELSGNQASLTSGEVNGTISPGSNLHGWMAKYAASGVLVWSALLPSPGSIGPGLLRLALDSDDDLHIIGDHNTPFDADPGAENLQMIADGAYLLKYANTDGALQWAVPFGDASGQHANGLHIDPDDNIYLACGGNAAWNFNGVEVGGGNVAILMKTGECLPPEILGQYEPISDYCEPTTDLLFVNAIGTAISFNWEQDGSPIGGNTDTVMAGPLYAGSYTFTCVLQGLCGADSIQPIGIGVSETPDPVIIEISGVLHCTAPGASGFVWLLNGVPIPGAYSAEWTPTENGTYTVWASTIVCVGVSDPFYFGGIGTPEIGASPITVLHQTGQGTVRIIGAPSGSIVELLTLTGQSIYRSTVTGSITMVDLGSPAGSVYLLRVAGQVFRVMR